VALLRHRGNVAWVTLLRPIDGRGPSLVGTGMVAPSRREFQRCFSEKLILVYKFVHLKAFW